MSIHHAARAALLFVLLATATVTATVPIAPTAAALGPTGGASLQLLGQTPYTTLKAPELRITVTATNTSDQTLDGLSLNVTIGQPIRSLVQYEASLAQGPGEFPLGFQPFPQTGTLRPGQTRRFRVELDVSTTYVLTSDSLVYPIQVDLRSRGAPTPLAVLNSSLLNLVRKPESRLRLAWWAEITAAPAFDPQGRLADPAFEASIAPTGSLGAEVAALRTVAGDQRPQAVGDVAIEPAVVAELVHMAAGYTRSDGTVVAARKGASADAASMLASLRAIAASPRIQVVAMPFSAPLLPSLMSNVLAPDLARQNDVGNAILSSALGVTVDPGVARPASGALNDAAVDALVRGGVDTILGNDDTVLRPAQPNDFAPLPTATLTTTTGAEAGLVLPDPGVTDLLDDATMQADPVRQAQAILGEIAAIWREAPVPAPQSDGSATVRGVALGLPSGLPARLWAPLLRRLVGTPFITPTEARAFVTEVNPAGDLATLHAPSSASFSRFYTGAIRDERNDAEAYDAMLATSGTQSSQLEQDLLSAEAGVYVGNEQTGRMWFDQVHTTTNEAFARVLPSSPDGPPTYTFTSRVGTIPIQMGDPGPSPLKVVVQLSSAYFRFPDGATQTVTLERPSQVVAFRVEATAGGGDHPIVMRVLAPPPSGRLINDAKLAVRTAAVNLIALLVTLAAALGLVLLWARRLLRRRGSHAA